jgi:hypothetical protein
MELEKRRQLIKFISADRFARYKSAMGGDADMALRLYVWNTAVSSAFWGPLQVLEIALRNALHDRLTAHFSREDWWNANALTLTVVHRRAVGDACDRVVEARRVPMSGRIVAELPLGFWVGLLGAGCNYEMTLWRPALRHAFVGKIGTRKEFIRILTDAGHFGIASHIMSRSSIGTLPPITCTSSGSSG